MAHWRQVTGVFDGCLSPGSTGLTNWSFLFKKEDLSKRSMYGRADFDLLKQRVLHHRRKRQATKNKRGQSPQEGRLKKPGGMENDTTSPQTTYPLRQIA